MTKDMHLMFEKYITARKTNVVNEIAAPVAQGGVPAPQGQASAQALEQANTKRALELLDTLKNDANLATKFALQPQEFASFIEWAKNKVSGGKAPVMSGESVVKEKKQEKDEDNLEMVAKPKSEETEEEYLARRDSAIKAAIAAKEESEEQAAMSTHYNTNHEALDLVDSLLNHPKRYSKADAVKVLTLALDKLHGKA